MSSHQPSLATQETLPATPRKPGTANTTRSPFLKSRSHLDDSTKRDSGLAPSVSTMGNESPLDGPTSSAAPARGKGNVPDIQLSGPPLASLDPRTDAVRPYNLTLDEKPVPEVSTSLSKKTPEKPNEIPSSPPDFDTITTSIPTGDFDDPFSTNLTFSNRGSVFLDGKKANALFNRMGGNSTHNLLDGAIPQRSISSADRRLSQRVRMLYKRGDESAVIERITEDPEEHVHDAGQPTRAGQSEKLTGEASPPPKQPWEAAGGIEDWRDVNTDDVDRYGFIKPRPSGARTPSNLSAQSGSQSTSPPQGSTLTPVSAETLGARKLRRPPPDASKTRRISLLSARPKSRQSSRPSSRAASRTETTAPSINSTHSRRSIFSSASTVNKGRRWADEAPDMLTSTEGFPADSPAKRADPAKDALERRREAKWEQMTSTDRRDKAGKALGGGNTFSFDIHDRKLIERTWKGIPDRWRASAWYSFLTTSARRQSTKAFPLVPDEELVKHFYAHQERDCGDDMQIDMDVPRTISGHVMFRARYRGGQRLMFRVLRALALEYPETGYVQGMAPLIATLLCYYDEERAFVVACRLWVYRGLAELFKPGFTGLMSALEVFERDWLSKSPAKATLDELGIPSMSYGTKWYLTLFCYSLPFAAQLRVWDIFILLGGGEGGVDGMGMRRQETTRAFMTVLRAKNTTATDPEKPDSLVAPAVPASPLANHGFDVLHAVSAALIDGLQDGLIGSDFENAMKLVTASVPVGREDVLMRVVKREWKEARKTR